MPSLLHPLVRSLASALFLFSAWVLSHNSAGSGHAPLLFRADDGLAKEYDEVLKDFLGSPTCEGNSTNPGSSKKGQQIAVASYISPLADPAAWTRLIGYSKDKVPILVANVVNGPDVQVNEPWKKIINSAAASGKIVLGYVRTGYLGVSHQQFKTRLGSGDLADWTAQIERDVDMWYELYGSSMGGIFFDEGWPECGPDNKYVKLYNYINDYTKRRHRGALTVLNPGSPIAQCYEDTMDTLLTFELSYEAYTSSYQGNGWVAKDPRKIWHIIYNTPASAIDSVAKLARERGAGLIQITDDVMPNPYDNLPSDSYMQAHMSAVEGGVPLNEEPSEWPPGEVPRTPSGLAASKADYSSVHLSWSPTPDAMGYNIYLSTPDGSTNFAAASVPPFMNAVTIGGLPPGASLQFYVKAIGTHGDQGPSSSVVSVQTLALPDGGKTVTKYSSSPGASSTTYQADILVPYAFVRLYIWDSVGCDDFQADPGWTVNFKSDNYVCTHYMVEGETLYKYSGTLPAGSTAPPWSWSVVGPVTVKIEGGYTYTWTVPLGTTTTDTSKFVVQAQGYGPFINAFSPSPDDYDCKGSGMCTTPDLVKWCDKAVNTLQRRDDAIYSNKENSLNGNCWGDQTRGCGVLIQGFQNGLVCEISGNDMWWAYQNIRKIGGCKRCGSWHRKDGCLVTVNYVSGCNNHG